MANIAAQQKREINRAASPMIYTEERLDETKDEARERQERLDNERNKKSTFLIGTIENVNQKISNLDQKLQSYTALVIESRASERSETESSYVSNPSARSAETSQHDRALAEAKEVNQFAGIYAMKSTFFGKQKEKAKAAKVNRDQNKAAAQKDVGKPKFVELHQYPGFDENELTALPNGSSAIEILAKVANAQATLKTKKKYLPEFERVFFSPMCQAMLQDIFWWLFLEKWQSSKSSQPKLFNRIAHNYVGVLLTADHPTYRDTFLKDFPSLMSQAIYAAFCDAFPDSYRQFNEDFKWDLVNLVFSWIAGLSPTPRLWHNWNMGALEPANIKQREELMTQAKKDKKQVTGLGEQDFPVSQPPPASIMSASQSTLHQAPSLSSLGSKRLSLQPRRAGARLKGKSSSSGMESVATGATGETPRQRFNSIHTTKLPPVSSSSVPGNRVSSHPIRNRTASDVHQPLPPGPSAPGSQYRPHRPPTRTLYPIRSCTETRRNDSHDSDPDIKPDVVQSEKLSTLESHENDSSSSSSKSLARTSRLFARQQQHHLKIDPKKTILRHMTVTTHDQTLPLLQQRRMVRQQQWHPSPTTTLTPLTSTSTNPTTNSTSDSAPQTSTTTTTTKTSGPSTQTSSSTGSSSRATKRSALAQVAPREARTAFNMYSLMFKGKQLIAPITEADEDEAVRMRAEKLEAYFRNLEKKCKEKESLPACKGPDFVRSVFNIQGQSPLVKHFLATQHLGSSAGTAMYIQRTQMENLPPLDTPTYKEIRKTSFRKVKEIGKGHQQLVEQGMKDTNRYVLKQHAQMLDYRRKEASLLSQQREVKRLSDLIMLELRKDEDSITAGAAAALETALAAQD